MDTETIGLIVLIATIVVVSGALLAMMAAVASISAEVNKLGSSIDD